MSHDHVQANKQWGPKADVPPPKQERKRGYLGRPKGGSPNLGTVVWARAGCLKKQHLFLIKNLQKNAMFGTKEIKAKMHGDSKMKGFKNPQKSWAFGRLSFGGIKKQKQILHTKECNVPNVRCNFLVIKWRWLVHGTPGNTEEDNPLRVVRVTTDPSIG